jgi:hypothetical protein
MVILYIYLICWLMKSAFYERQHWSRRWVENRIIDLDSGCLLVHNLLGFFRGGGEVVALRLPARVLQDLALGPADESSANLVLGVRAEIWTTQISMSPSKQRMGVVKLSRA